MTDGENNNDDFGNFYINFVFTLNINSGFAVRKPGPWSMVSFWGCDRTTHVDTADQAGSACPCAPGLILRSPPPHPHPLLLLAVTLRGGRASMDRIGISSSIIISRVKFQSCLRRRMSICVCPDRRWDANRVLINDNEFFTMCQLPNQPHGQAMCCPSRLARWTVWHPGGIFR